MSNCTKQYTCTNVMKGQTKYQLMQMPSVKNMNCDSDVKIILNQYKQCSGNSHNVCVCVTAFEWGWNDNIREFGGSHSCWYTVGRKSLAWHWLPSMFKNWRKLLKAIITVTKHRPVVMTQNYTRITMGIRFLTKNKIRMPHVHQNQIDGDQFPQPEGAGL
jgi:hypothetical protein